MANIRMEKSNLTLQIHLDTMHIKAIIALGGINYVRKNVSHPVQRHRRRHGPDRGTRQPEGAHHSGAGLPGGGRGLHLRVKSKNGPAAVQTCKKEMTLDCPFRNPLQSRVIPVLSYYLTSIWLPPFLLDTLRRIPFDNPPVLPRPSFLLPLLRPNSSYVRPFGRIAFLLAAGVCRFALTGTFCPSRS